METTLFFYLADALNWVKKNTNINTDSIESGFTCFDYVPQNVFSYVLTAFQFETLRKELVWLTANDIRQLGDGAVLPNLYVINPRTPETSSLVRIVSGNDKYVKFTHVYDDSHEVYEMTNRQFVMNSQKV